jgi:hypothetical protein
MIGESELGFFIGRRERAAYDDVMFRGKRISRRQHHTRRTADRRI